MTTHKKIKEKHKLYKKIICEDDRGIIYQITSPFIHTEEITLLHTKEGYARGGCVHDLNDEICIVLEGQITHFSYPNPDNNYDFSFHVLGLGAVHVIPKGTPHYFISDTDSVVIEMGATIAEKKKKNNFIRGIVDDINKQRRGVNDVK